MCIVRIVRSEVKTTTHIVENVQLVSSFDIEYTKRFLKWLFVTVSQFTRIAAAKQQ